LKKIILTYSFLLLVAFAGAQSYFKIDSLKRELLNADSSEMARIYNEMIWTMRNNKPLEAVDYGKQAVILSKRFENYRELAKTYSFMGVLYRNAGNFDEALVYYSLGLEVAEKYKIQDQIGYAHINFGNWYIYSTNFEKSIYHLKKALEISEKEKNLEMISYCNLNLGRAYLITNQVDTALLYFNKALKIRIETNNTTGQSICYKFIADVYNIKKDNNKALKLYETAFQKADKKFDIDLVADIYNKQARIYIENKNYQDALKFAENGIESSLQTKSPVRIKQAYESLSDIYQNMGKYEIALRYKDFVKLYNDTFYNEQLSEKISNVKFEMDSKTKQTKIDSLFRVQEIQSLELKNKNTQFVALLIFVLLTIAVIIIVSYYSKQRQKANKLLRNQKNQITEQYEELRNLNEEISSQRDEIQKQNYAIEKQQVQITDSIIYAQRIQKAVLPPDNLFKEILPYHFILFKPRDIVSGDFYWIKKIEKYIIVTAADCTGHGIPGAFVSMLGMSLLNNVTTGKIHKKANLILEELREHIKSSLRQTHENESQDDGIDMALCIIDTENLTLQFAGANNPLFIVRNEQLTVIEPTLNPVGIYFREKEFANNEYQLEKNDNIYMFSDGYSDQFGGPEGRRFMSQNFRDLIISIQKYPMPQQKNMLEKKFNEWKGKTRQIDDILILGIKIAF
jgi:serine phosphatase RsbU (regulator of sigma subunit)